LSRVVHGIFKKNLSCWILVCLVLDKKKLLKRWFLEDNLRKCVCEKGLLVAQGDDGVYLGGTHCGV